MSALSNVVSHERLSRESRQPSGTIGALLVAEGRLTVANAERVLELQKTSSLPFGEAAVRLGVLNSEDVQFALSKQFSMARLRSGDVSIDASVIAAFQPAHAAAEQMRHLRGQLMLRWLNSEAGGKAVAVVGVEVGAGCSFTVANLAVVFAQLGQRILLIDANLKQPQQHLLFRVSNRIGLSSILAERAGEEAIAPIASMPGLSVLPSGPVPPNVDDLLSRPALGALLDRLATHFDAILIDTPAWSQSAGTAVLVTRTRAALLVARAGRSTVDASSQVASELAAANVLALGVVFNRR